ncbi:Tetracycline repressor protein class H [Corynebacterium atrinae]|uniref:TetR/AcrR family transcriptional regulator n=1 Tax=Corynebacterium atrinae TaxID=1336740 RepID=UPI0025B4945F|nr:TetR/AcrR family transcriptional regulator [Corynebacterium atrinae]WJY63866.1 Tetracycline repressor protein class H [Corynebacterium atrinae]
MDRPTPQPLTHRTAAIISVAREMLEETGWETLTMRRLAERVGMKAPSLYNHVANKEELGTIILTQSFFQMGDALWEATTVANLLDRYRTQATRHPHHYRLATTGPLERSALPPGLEDWSGAPFARVTGDPLKAQSLFASTHGLAILEIDGRFPPGSPIDDLWEQTAEIYR